MKHASCTVMVVFFVPCVGVWYLDVDIFIILTLSEYCAKWSIFYPSMLCWNDLLITLHKHVLHQTGESKRQTAPCVGLFFISLIDTNIGTSTRTKALRRANSSANISGSHFCSLCLCHLSYETLSSCRSARCLGIFLLHKSNPALSRPPSHKNTSGGTHTAIFIYVAVILLAT